jgi:hypothetical protein
MAPIEIGAIFCNSDFITIEYLFLNFAIRAYLFGEMGGIQLRGVYFIKKFGFEFVFTTSTYPFPLKLNPNTEGLLTVISFTCVQVSLPALYL